MKANLHTPRSRCRSVKKHIPVLLEGGADVSAKATYGKQRKYEGKYYEQWCMPLATLVTDRWVQQ
jgi:hypothetical protein